jgi:hypothetical protein
MGKALAGLLLQTDSLPHVSSVGCFARFFVGIFIKIWYTQ